MSSFDQDGGPAFPTTARTEKGKNFGNANIDYDVPVPARDGMTLRDYFAAKIASGDAAAGDGWGEPDLERLRARARFYYAMADAMIHVRGE
jgi:hypothetical protein